MSHDSAAPRERLVPDESEHEEDGRSGEGSRRKPKKPSMFGSLESNLRGILSGPARRRERRQLAAQREARLRALLRAVESVYQGIGSVLLTTRTGEVVMWSHTIEPQKPEPVPAFEDDDVIPEDLRKQDDEAVKGDPELNELLVAISVIHRLSRRFVPETMYSQHLRRALERKTPNASRSPVFRVFGDETVFSCYTVGPGYLLSFYSDQPSHFLGEEERRNDSKLKVILDSLRGVLYPEERPVEGVPRDDSNPPL